MVTARCSAAECARCDGVGDFAAAGDVVRRPRTLQPTVNCCMACCYATGVTAAAAAATKKYCATTRARTTGAAASAGTAYNDGDADDGYADDGYDGPSSEAAAFVASASAAAFVLLAALLAVVLSWVAVLCLASLAPTAVAAAQATPGPRAAAADYLHRWHHQQQPRPYPPWRQQQQQQQRRASYGDDGDEAARLKRQLLFKNNNNREPGIVALTFSLIGGTISDAREAYRNVSGIVRDTISEAARVQQPTTTAATDQMMMAAVNTADNEIATSSTPAAPAVDQNAFGRLFGRNFRGLRRLFNSELRTALKNSPGNVRDFAVELVGSVGQSLRPSKLLTRGPVTSDSNTTR